MSTATTSGIRIHATGGPDVLRWERFDLPGLESGDVLVRHTAVGLNFIDTYHRSGLYPVGDLPAVLGMEAAGIVEAVGSDSGGLTIGDRVGYLGPRGAYAESRVIRADALVPIPASIDDETVAALLLKGLTAHLLLFRAFVPQPGDTVLVHAAAGGVGSLLTQWASARDVRVIGTVGSEAKAERASRQGCEMVIRYRDEDIVERVREMTDGAGVVAVYDGVGKATFDASLECLARDGAMISFGNASGAVPPFDVLRLTPKGLSLQRPSVVASYLNAGQPALLRSAAEELFAAHRDGVLDVAVGQRFALRDAADAHRALEARETSGSTLLMP